MTTRTCIREVVIPASEAHAPDAWRACLWVGYFVEGALDRGGYEPDELPSDAIRFADLWEYHGQRSNGGHGQYEENTNDDASAWQRAASLLEAMGLPQYRALLDEFIRFASHKRGRLRRLHERGDSMAAMEMFYGFDDRFAELERNGPTLQQAMHDWLLKQPWVVIDHADAPADMDRLRRSIPPHPMAEARHAARMRRRHAENNGSLLALISRHLRR